MGKHKKTIERPLPETLGLPRTGVDAHAHLDPLGDEGPGLSEDVPGVLERAARAGLSAVGQVFLSPEAYEAGKDRFAGAPVEVFFLLAIHPCEAMRCTGVTLDAMKKAFLSDDRLRAVGETGLDFYWQDCPHIIQEEALRLHLALAKEVKRPVAIHCRDAAAETLRILEAEGMAGYPLVWHCFSGDAVAHAERILANGWHVSVAGPVSYPANGALRDVLRQIPADRLLLETDSPYLAPVPWRGKPNEPAFCAFTGAAVAEALDEDAADLWTRCGDNARRFYGLAPRTGAA